MLHAPDSMLHEINAPFPDADLWSFWQSKAFSFATP
jgi:hypothetical protein